MFKKFIEQLKRDMGSEQILEAKEDGSCCLFLEPEIEITLRENPDETVTFYSKVAPLPLQNTEEYLQTAMVANLFGRETGGATLGLDQEGKWVVLLEFCAEQNYRAFHEHLEDFANYADAWRAQTRKFVEKQGVE
jgi:hypothetical protein